MAADEPKLSLLAFDTCFDACSVAVRVDANLASERRAARLELMAKGHAERLFPLIDEVLRTTGATYSDLDGIAVTNGPGSFTGTRVGIAAARGLALATGLPVFGASSLAAIAGSALRHHHGADNVRPIAVCVDARRGQLYMQLVGAADAKPVTKPRIINIGEAASALPMAGEFRLAGNGTEVLRSAANNDAALDRALSRATMMVGEAICDAEALLDVWLERLNPPKTLYLRAPDAKPQAGKSIPKAFTGTGEL